jgi:hypothetical protein
MFFSIETPLNQKGFFSRLKLSQTLSSVKNQHEGISISIFDKADIKPFGITELQLLRTKAKEMPYGML